MPQLSRTLQRLHPQSRQIADKARKHKREQVQDDEGGNGRYYQLHHQHHHGPKGNLDIDNNDCLLVHLLLASLSFYAIYVEIAL
jgi:hypothetical protein